MKLDATGASPSCPSATAECRRLMNELTSVHLHAQTCGTSLLMLSVYCLLYALLQGSFDPEKRKLTCLLLPDLYRPLPDLAATVSL